MDHNDIRKGILQAKLVDETSGLLFIEILFVPLLLSFLFAQAKYITDPNWDVVGFLAVGFFSFVLFVWCSFHRRPRFWMAVFFSCIWAYGSWKFFGLVIHDKPLSAYNSITPFLVHNGFRAIPSIFLFILTMILHSSDFQWMDDVSVK